MSFKDRLDKLQNTLRQTPDMGYWIEDSVSIRYLTGLQLSTGILLITAQDAVLLVDGRYLEVAKTEQSLYSVGSSDTADLTALLQSSRFAKITRFGISDLAPFHRFTTLAMLLNPLRKAISPLKDPCPWMQLRMQKDPEELKALTEAANLGCEGFDYVCTLLQDGVTEKEVAKKLEIFWLEKGADGLAFPPIIAFGAHSSQPHAKSGSYQLAPGDAVLIDIGVTLNGYHSDMTRTLFWKSVSSKMEEIYMITLKAQQAALDACHAGMSAGQLDQVARQFITEAGYGKEFAHGLGHAVGLEIHELPRLRSQEPYSKAILSNNMVVTIEPGIYLPGAFGVRIEDTVIVHETGCTNLTPRSKELTVLG